MKWNKFTLHTTTAAIDFVGELFDEIGIVGMEIEDNVPLTEAETKGMFIDILPELPPDDGTARISFYLDNTYDIPATLQAVREGMQEIGQFVPVGSLEIDASETEDKDWMNNWKEFFKPFTVDDILIKPTWESVPEEHKDKLLVQIDPGTAFGTGMHETTQLCIRALRKYLKAGDHVLDVGCGSGILSITSILLGAADAVGTDLDEAAIVATNENREANDIAPEKLRVLTGNIISDPAIKDAVGYGCYDVVVANILAEVIVPLQGVIAPHLKQGGIFITSGIINLKEETVREALQANPELEILEVNHQKDWGSFVCRKVSA